MALKTQLDYSPNFNPVKRNKKQIKFIVFHYTGMKKESDAINKLTNIQSQVSSHYFIKNNGDIILMVPDLYTAWHAGKSKWKNFNNLNDSSIGIELVNKGHEFGYQNFSKNQITSLISLCKFLKKKYMIKKENFLGHSDIAPLRKLDPGEKFPWEKLNKFKLGRWYKDDNKKLKLTNKKGLKNLFFKNLYLIGYRYFHVFIRRKKDKLVVKSFQQHYLPNNVSGKIDKKTYKISQFLVNSSK